MLEIRNLRFEVDGKVILDDLNLKVERGEIHGILGVNGTGKTTLAYIIMGLLPTSGKIFFEGEDITRLSITERAKRGITLAWQEPARFEGLRVGDYLLLNGKADIGEIKGFLRSVGLPPEQYLSRFVDATLSGGERKRIELASVMAMKPKLAVLDEPDSGIDMISLPYIINGIMRMAERGTSVLLITHSESTVEIAHRVSLICAGRIIKTGSPKEICRWFKEHCQICTTPNEPKI